VSIAEPQNVFVPVRHQFKSDISLVERWRPTLGKWLVSLSYSSYLSVTWMVCVCACVCVFVCSTVELFVESLLAIRLLPLVLNEDQRWLSACFRI